MIDLNSITSIEDLRKLAKKRTPKMFFDYVESGSWTESTFRANCEDFKKIKFKQRVAVDISNRDTSVEIFGIESPGLTSALSIANKIVENYL